jgi:DNA recombination protein RmuC
MVEILLVLTLLVAISIAGLLALFLSRARGAEREAREELSRGLATFSQTLSTQMGASATVHNGQMDGLRKSIDDNLARVQDLQRSAARETRETLEQRLDRLQQDNSAKLEQMRQTVDEKLQSTLEKRLSESFKQVSERLELVHKGLGEMHTLAAGVGDLKRVLTNVKTRGVFGETQLAALLEQVMAPEQYEKNVATRPGSNARVEFAIKLPGRDGGGPVFLPIDAKFPQEDYQRLQAALESGDLLAAEVAGKALEARVKLEARSIAEKYVEPPHTTDFAILYLPFEGLFAEVLRRPGLFDHIQRESRITVCGPTNLLAYLNSLQMGFRTLAIQQRSSEVWKVLGTVKSEFGKFAEVLANTKRQLQTVANTIDQAEVRTRQIERKLKDVEVLPGAESVQEDLQLEEKAVGDLVRLPKQQS